MALEIDELINQEQDYISKIRKEADALYKRHWL